MRSPVVDASTPAAVSGSVDPITIGSFTPPGSSIVLLFCWSDANTGATNERITVTCSVPTIQMVDVAFRNGSPGACIELWACYVSQPQAMSFSISSNQGSVAKRCFPLVYRDTAGIGAITIGTGLSASYTSTADGSLGFGFGLGSNTQPVATGGETLVDGNTGFDSGDAQYLVRNNSVTSGKGTSVTMAVTGPASGVHFIALELLPVDVGPPPLPLPPYLVQQLLAVQSLLTGGASTVAPGTPETGIGPMPVTSAGTALKNAIVVGSCSLPARVAGTVVRGAGAVTGRTVLPALAAGLPAHGSPQVATISWPARAAGTPARGALPAGRAISVFTTAGADSSGTSRSQTGTTAVPVVQRGTAVRAALPAGRTTAVSTAVSTAVRGAVPAGRVVAIARPAGAAVRGALPTGRTMPVLGAAGSARRGAQPAGTAATALRAAGALIRQAVAAASARIALGPSGTPGKSAGAAGRTVIPVAAVRSSGVAPPPTTSGRAATTTTHARAATGTAGAHTIDNSSAAGAARTAASRPQAATSTSNAGRTTGGPQ